LGQSVQAAVVDAAVAVEYHLLHLLGFGGGGDLLAYPGGLVGHAALGLFVANGAGVDQGDAFAVVDNLGNDVSQADLNRQTRSLGGAGNGSPNPGAAAV